MTQPSLPLRAKVASVLGCLIGGMVYFAVLLDLRWQPGRTAVPLGYASNFFDIQAAAFLDGHVDVPSGSLGIEGFERAGRTYMYFPPFPALIRLPVMLVTREFDGRLTVLSMAVAWVVFAVMATRLLWLTRSVLTSRPPSHGESGGALIMLVAITGGTVLTFVASLPWVYHEVYAWAIAVVVGAMYWLVRTALDPSRHSLTWLAAFAVAAVWTRTTGGFAVCGAILVLAGWSGWRARRSGADTSPWMRVAVVGVIPLVASVSLNMVKFDHPYMFPLESQVWTSVNEHRRTALEVNGGTITGPQFIATTAHTYFRLDGLRFTDYYPWVSLPAEPPALEGSALFDQTYRTASITATTPLLLVLSLLAVPLAWRRRDVRRILMPPLMGSWAVGGGVLMYGYIANRYTSEFVPALVVGGIVGFWLIVPGVLARGRKTTGVSLVLLALLTMYSVLAHASLGVTMVAMTQKGPRLEDHVRLQHQLSGGADSPQSRLLRVADGGNPGVAPTDTLAITSDCRETLLSTGDRYEPWVVVAAEPVVMEVTLHRDVEPGRFTLLTIETTRPRQVDLEIRADHHVRIVVGDDFSSVEGPWFGVYPETSFRLGVAPRPEYEMVEVSTTPGGFVAVAPWIVRGDDGIARPAVITQPPDLVRMQQKHEVTVLTRRGVTPHICRLLTADLTGVAR